MTSISTQTDDRDRVPGGEAAGWEQSERLSEAGLGSSGEPEDEPSVEDWAEAERSRPDLAEETADGLDDMDEEVRHQAEDLPLDTPGRL